MLTDNYTDNLLSGYFRIIYYPDLSGYPWASLWATQVDYSEEKTDNESTFGEFPW